MDIQTYNEKRDFNKTSEPKGIVASEEGNIFCVQEHHASHLHYDFRLELDGVLKSWAVPKGPSLDPTVKRLAVHVEDHPLDYADFEGRIPKGEYGAGEVKLWDKGSWTPIKDPKKGHSKGRLEFELNGEKLRGKWALIKMKGRGEKNWLLIKMKDDFASEEEITKTRPESVKKKDVTMASPQLAVTKDQAPEGDKYIREIKHDGYRTLVSMADGQGLVYSRNKKDWSSKLSFILDALKEANITDIILDGETARLDENGVSSFGELQESFNSNSTENLTYFAFDILGLEGKDLRPLAQIERKKILKEVFEKIDDNKVRYCEHFEEEGQLFFEKMKEFGLEGMMSKDKSAPYTPGRNDNWTKTKCLKTEPFVVIGFTTNEKGIASLLIARKNEKGKLEVGKVGSGLSKKDSRLFEKRLERRSSAPKNVKVPKTYQTSDVQYCEPELVAQVRFSESTKAGALRHPVFEGLREDLGPEQVLSWESDDEKVKRIITSLRRELWPNITKENYGHYLLKLEDKIGPWLYKRPLTLFKCPRGVMQDCFFSKHIGNMRGLKEVTIERKGDEKEYFEVTNLEELLHIARYSAVEFHVWNSTSKDPWTAKEMVLDLDPGSGITESVLIDASLKVKKMLEALELVSFPKTTGKKGLHIHLPLVPEYSVDQVYQLSKSIAYILEEEAPHLFTSSSKIKDRKNKIYIDYMRNAFGATFIAPYSPRAISEAYVALPIDWKELENSTQLPRLTLKEALEGAPSSTWDGYWNHAQEIELFKKE